MADKAAPKANTKEVKEKGAKKSKLPLIIVTALMLGEGAAIFIVAKIMFGPSPLEPATAAQVATVESDSANPAVAPVDQMAEVDIADCRPSNKATGRLQTYRLRVSALVRSGDAEKVGGLVESNRARIEDRVNFVVRSAEPHHLEEPGLETIKRRMKRELDQILGDEQLILEILIPELLQA